MLRFVHSAFGKYSNQKGVGINMNSKKAKVIIICESNYNGNTDKIAKAMQSVLKATLVKPDEVKYLELNENTIVGLGSGIKFGKHDKKLIDTVQNINVKNLKVFLFSTRCKPYIGKYHNYMKQLIKEKNWELLAEFSALGYDGTGPWSLIGGYNKGRPNENDLRRAEKFARKLKITPTIEDPFHNSTLKLLKKGSNRNIYTYKVDGESVSIYGYFVSVNWFKCIGCGKCVEQCPIEVFKLVQTEYNNKTTHKSDPIQEKECVICKKCVRSCPTDAIYLHTKWNDAFKVVSKHQHRYDE